MARILTWLIDLDADEWLENNDVFEHDEMAWRITRLETEDGVVEAIEASNLIRAVALRQDMHRVKITKARGDISTPDVLIVEDGTQFKAGTILEIGFKHGGFEQFIQGRTDSQRYCGCFIDQADVSS